MVGKGMLSETATHLTSNETTDYFKTLKEPDKKLILEIKSLYGRKSANALMKYTYLHFPYWAIHSVKAKEILSEAEYIKVLNSKPKNNKTILFTIGYEGISLEEYLNRLLKNDIKVLVDVRNNTLFKGRQILDEEQDVL